ncbi:hypothetical protein, partial [Candidatus Methylomicrobium oryzae]|uniref:hypothetical protein n=1 Tax=Candidatus Methylomicrobium oryzae TaxID=2802053 RepID=UPI001F350E3E
LPTTAGMQEVGQRKEQLPTTAGMQEVGQRKEQLPSVPFSKNSLESNPSKRYAQRTLRFEWLSLRRP